MHTLREQRSLLHALLDDANPVDAPTAYYALYHDPARSSLFVSRDTGGMATGFVGRFQTGIDLFRPLVTLRCPDADTAADLLAEALVPGRPYLLFSNLNQLALTGGSLEISNERILLVYVLDRARFKPEINVLVKVSLGPGNTPRAEIKQRSGRAVASANWQSPGFTELYVDVDSEAQQKGWGRSVLLACAGAALAGGRLPIYLVEPGNTASVRLAESAGFTDTGARHIFADALYMGHPGRSRRARP
jgi:hypothetical protein